MECLNDCTTIQSTAVLVSDWLFANASLNGMEEESGSSPKRDKERPSTSPFRDTRGQSVPRPYNLLLAEDNLPDVLLIREAIRKEGLPVEVFVVSDGQQAIEFIARAEKDDSAPCPHFLLIDLNLPKRSGFDVLRRVRASERCKTAPVLIVTSSDSQGDRNLASELGAGYFQKPPSYDEFLKLGGVLKQLLQDHEKA